MAHVSGGSDSSGTLVMLAAAGAAAYWYFFMRTPAQGAPAALPAVTLAPATSPAIVVDGSGQVLPSASDAAAAAAAFAQPTAGPGMTIPADAVSAPVGYTFLGIYKVLQLGTGGLTCLIHGGVCGDASSVYVPKGTIVGNTRDGSTYTVEG